MFSHSRIRSLFRMKNMNLESTQKRLHLKFVETIYTCTLKWELKLTATHKQAEITIWCRRAHCFKPCWSHWGRGEGVMEPFLTGGVKRSGGVCYRGHSFTCQFQPYLTGFHSKLYLNFKYSDLISWVWNWTDSNGILIELNLSLLNVKFVWQTRYTLLRSNFDRWHFNPFKFPTVISVKFLLIISA